jgi:hypothetical protein
MAISDAQKVDLLFKQAFGVTKTDTSTNKVASNESIASPAIVRGDKIWSQSDQIPATAAFVSGIVESKIVECTVDNTTVPVGGIYPTWKTSFTNWIPVEFGPTYSVKVYINDTGKSSDPTVGGTQIFDAGVGGVGEYYFNYSSGVLNFIGTTIPASLTGSKKVYIVGYRYIGSVGSAALPSNTNIGDINITGNTISATPVNSNLTLSGNGTGSVNVVGTGNIYANNFIASQGVLTNNLYYANGEAWDLQEAAGSDGQLQFNNGDNFAADANLSFNSGTANLTIIGNVNVGSSGNVKLYANGSVVATDFTGNLTGNVTGNIANIGANLNVLYNYDGKVASNVSLQYNPTTNSLTVGNTVTSNYFIGKFDTTSNNQSNITTLGNLTGLQVGTTATAITLSTNGNANIVNLNASGNVTAVDGTFTGNLVVSGMTTFVNTTNTSLKDPLITLGGNAEGGNISAADNKDRGFLLDNYYNGAPKNQGLIWKTANSQFELGSNVEVADNIVTIQEYGNIKASTFLGNLVGSNVNVTNVTGTFTVASNSQPNITSVGTLTSLNVSGLANVSQLKVSAVTYPNTTGTEGQYLRTYSNGTIYYSSLDASKISNGSSQVNVLNNGNIVVSFDSGSSNAVVFATNGDIITGSGSSGNISGVDVLYANIANVAKVTIGNSNIMSTTVTTAGTSTDTLATIDATTFRGVEFIVKGENSSGGKYSVATLLAVHNNSTTVDFTTYGTVSIGGSTGTLSVIKDSTNVYLKVVPSSSDTTVWTTQYRLI